MSKKIVNDIEELEDVVLEDDDEETYLTLPQVRKMLLEEAKKNNYQLDQDDVMEATNHLDLKESDLEKLITYFKNHKITVISDIENDEEDPDFTKFVKGEDLDDVDDDLNDDDEYDF